MTSEKHNNKLCKSYFCRSSYRNGRVFGHGQRENLNTMPSRVSIGRHLHARVSATVLGSQPANLRQVLDP